MHPKRTGKSEKNSEFLVFFGGVQASERKGARKRTKGNRKREESRAIHTFFSARESSVSLELLVGESLTLTVTENLKKFVTL